MVENSCCLYVKEVRWVTVLHDRTRWNWTRLAMQCNAMQHICICVSVYLRICGFVYLRICVFVYFHDSHLWNWTLSCDATHLKNCNNFWLGHLFDLNTGSIFEEEIAFWIFADQRSSCCLSATSVCSLLLILPGDLPLHRLPCWALSYIPGKVALAQNNPHLFPRICFTIFIFFILCF